MRLFRVNGNRQLKGINLFSWYQVCLFILLLWCMQGVVQWLKIHSEVPDILTTITQIIQIVFLRFLFHKAWWLILPLTNFTWRIVYLASKYWFLVCLQVVNVGRSSCSDLHHFFHKNNVKPEWANVSFFFKQSHVCINLIIWLHVLSSFNNFEFLKWRKAEFSFFLSPSNNWMLSNLSHVLVTRMRN